MRVRDEDPILRGSPLRAVWGAVVSHIYFAGTTTDAPVYIAGTGATLATPPFTTNSAGYVIDANDARVWYEEGAYDRVIDGQTHTFQAVSGLSGAQAATASVEANTVVTSTTLADVSGGTIAIDGNGRPVDLVVNSWVQIVAANNLAAGSSVGIQVDVYDVDNSVANFMYMSFATRTVVANRADTWQATLHKVRVLPAISAGTTRTFKLRAAILGAASSSTGTLLGASGWPSLLMGRYV